METIQGLSLSGCNLDGIIRVPRAYPVMYPTTSTDRSSRNRCATVLFYFYLLYFFFLVANRFDRHIFIHSFQNRSIATTTTAAHGPKAELLDCSETNFRCAEIARSTIKQRRQPNEGARPLIIASSAGFDVA